MPSVPDLVRDSKLDTQVLPDRTVHSYVETGQSRRRVSRQEDWKTEKHLGQGSYGQVELQKCVVGSSVGTLRAVKKVLKRSISSNTISYNRELEAVAKFSHPRYEACFVKSFGWYEDPEAIYIAMEYCPYGDLQRYFSHTLPLPMAEAQELTRQILEGLYDMHANGFAHRDLKPANILIKSRPPDNWWVKLADFGISKRAEDGNGPSTIKGTLEFMAPELLGFVDSTTNSAHPSPEAADMWALGEIASRMLAGEGTFKDIRALSNYCQGQQEYPSRRLMSLAGEDPARFIIDLMAVDPHDRMSAKDALHHPWMKLHNADSGKDGATEPISNNLHPQLEQVKPPEVPMAGWIQEASGRWSTISDMQTLKPSIHSISELPSIPVSINYPQFQGPSGQVQKEREPNERLSISLISEPIPYRQSEEPDPQDLREMELPFTREREPVNVAPAQDQHQRQSPDQTAPPKEVKVTKKRPILTLRSMFKKNTSNQDAGSDPAGRALKGHKSEVIAVAFSRDGAWLASASLDETVRLWDPHSKSALLALNGHTGSVRSVSFSPDGAQLASASNDKTLRLWVIRPGATAQTFSGHEDSITAVMFSPAGKLLVSASFDKTVRLWNVRSGAAVRTLDSHDASVRAVTFSPDGKRLASASYDKMIKLWDIESGTVLQTLSGHEGSVRSVAFSPDGKQLVSASYDKTVKLWDVRSGAASRTHRGHSGPVFSVMFSPDGERFASASSDKTIMVRDTRAGMLLRTLRGHEDAVRAVAYSPDGKQLASASFDKTIRLWDARSGVAV